MRYFIHCLLRGDVEKYHKKLVNDVAEKFGLRVTKEESMGTHFTLKYHYEAEDQGEVDEIIGDFCRSHRKTPVMVGGFGGFHQKIVFIDVKLSEEAKKNFLDFIHALREVKWVTWEQHEAEKLHFHATIAEECDEKYGDILDFLRGKEKYFDCWFDNVTIIEEILREGNIVKKWKVHKTYQMK